LLPIAADRIQPMDCTQVTGSSDAFIYSLHSLRLSDPPMYVADKLLDETRQTCMGWLSRLALVMHGISRLSTVICSHSKQHYAERHYYLVFQNSSGIFNYFIHLLRELKEYKQIFSDVQTVTHLVEHKVELTQSELIVTFKTFAVQSIEQKYVDNCT